jgi:hypothetical protein
MAEAVPPLLLSGPAPAVRELRGLLTAGGEQALVQQIGILDLERPEVTGAAGIVHVIRGEATPADEHALCRAERRLLPTLCIVLSTGPDGSRVLPYVPATDVLRARKLDAPAVRWLGQRLAVRAPEAAWALASRLPALQDPVTRSLVERYARRNALVAAATFAKGRDFPTLTLNELRLTLRLAAVAGAEPRNAQLLAAGTSLGGGVALRALARRLDALLPLPGWAVQAAVAYAGTRVIGLAAVALAAHAGGAVRRR